MRAAEIARRMPLPWMGMAASRMPRFEIDAQCVQRLYPQGRSYRFEGLAFSPSGDLIAAATSETNSVVLYRRGPDGRFEDAPCQVLGTEQPLDYPHDVSFCQAGNDELMAVAQRAGTVTIYQRRSGGSYGPDPAFEIRGERSRLIYSDGAAFVPPDHCYLAVCNLDSGTVLFFRRLSLSPLAFEEIPAFELRHGAIVQPDGLAFSRCGTWLATANHGNRSVAVFRRQRLANGEPLYGPRPVALIDDPLFCFPHSLVFTPRSNHLVVTNAGANYFGVYAPERGWLGTQWSCKPVSLLTVQDVGAFRAVNMKSKYEGGAKGVAVHDDLLAVCSPQIGISIYRFREPQ